MIVVTTPTGNIGSKLLEELLEKREEVRVIVRDPAKLPEQVRDTVDVIIGSTDDERTLFRALAGAESLFWVVPPSFKGNNDIEYYLSFTRPMCKAIKAQGIKRVVTVSGLGRNIAVDAGPVTASFMKDEAIEETGIDFRALWCPGFMENMLNHLGTVKEDGRFFVPSPPDLKMPFVATRDIAAIAASLLMDDSWTGQTGVAALGPEDLSYNDIAAILSAVLSQPIQFQRITGEVMRSEMIAKGANDVFARGVMNMRAAKANGLDNSEPRTSENTTPTTFRQWAEEVFLPAFRS